MNTVRFALVLALAAGVPVPSGDPADVLKEADRAFFRATREKGLEGWLAWFASDAVVFPPSGALAVGSEAVRRHFEAQSGFPARGFIWEPERAGISASGDLGWTIGRAGNDATGTAVWQSHYLTVWRKTSGAWQVVSDCGYDERFAARLPGLGGPPATFGREAEEVFTSDVGDLFATAGSWWANDAGGAEAGGKFLSVWRKNAEHVHELEVETGILQVKR